jgi:cyclic beta-1,2-glucan synthetase
MKANNLVEPVKEIRRTPEPTEPLLPRLPRPVFAEPEPLEVFARKASLLAASHQVSKTKAQAQMFVPDMIENVRQLLAAHQQCVAAVSAQRTLSSAAQYLLNNFAPVEKQLREISANLKPGSDRALPKLSGGALDGYPRIYVIALSLVEDTNGCLDAETLERYFRAYQDTAPLDIGELKSVRAMLRLALIEALHQLASSFVRELEKPEASVAHADRMDRVQETDEASTVGKIINSLRWLSAFDVQRFFDSVSVVEFILGNEPSGTYPLMEAATRENYCRAVTDIARKTGSTEPAVAQRAIELASEAAAALLDDRRRADVGYYLIDVGTVALELSLGYTPRLRERLSRIVKRHPTSLYLGLLVSFTIIIIAPFIFYAAYLEASALVVVCLAALLVVPASDLVLSILNTILSFKPTSLPRMDFSRGIPEEAQTMVVVPAIISSEAVLNDLLEAVEAHFLSNQDPHIFFALLTDWSDSAQESMPLDEALLQAALDGIEKLNERYHEGARDRFYLFQRRRRWNQSQGTWMGWERKRGKLHEFNQLLRGSTQTSYLNVTADGDFLALVRYVITLDSDTLLPRDAARRLIGTISHPLNRPQLDKLTGRVVHGYGIIQPRVDMPPPAAPRRSIPVLLNDRFQANTSSPVVPNLYQDLFGESNYVGKGLYEVDVFEAALENRIPENLLLSHDLFEGLYARTALASDIKIFDNPQSNYETVAQRQHRWTRGDWQLWPWLLSRVPSEHAAGVAARNVLPLIARWKILDNLRRSLVQPFLLLWLIAAWTILPGSALVWTLLVILTLIAKFSFSVVPHFLSISRQSTQAGPSKRFPYLVKLFARQCLTLALQLIISLVYLAHQSYLMLDAITRTLYRRLISGKRLLEWVTAAQVQKDSAVSLGASVRYMWGALVIAPACGALIFVVRPQSLLVAAPFLLAWMVSPFVVHIFNGRIGRRALGLEQVVERALRLGGHRMWQTLESTLGVRYDLRSTGNIEKGSAYINPRGSSPVNLARLLLWTRAAHELGSIATTELTGRLELTLVEMQKLKRSTGERRKTYAASSAAPSVSPFILQAENGNLAGHLRGITQFCTELAERPLFDERVLRGLADTLSLMTDGLKRISITPAEEGVVRLCQLGEEVEMCTAFLRRPLQEKAPQTLAAWRRIFNTLAQRAVLVEVVLNVLAEKYAAKNIVELGFWNNHLARQVQGLNEDLQLFAPWTSIRTAPLTLLIRKHDAPSLAQWNRINEMLDGIYSISHLPKTLHAALIEIKGLSGQLERRLPSNSVERATVLDGCANLKTALETALQTSHDTRARYAQLTDQSTTIMQTINFGRLFDEEREATRNRFPDRAR